MEQNILLDPSIQHWVLLPLIVIVLFMSVLKHYVTLLMNSAPTPVVSKIVNGNIVNYGQLLLQSGKILPSPSFKTRCVALLEGDLKKKVDPVNPMESMSDPNMMMGMLKDQAMNMVPNIGMMMLVSYFFSGFVVAKFPFALSNRFRGMMQEGMDTDDLSCSYVTSLSMYWLIMFACQGILQLVLGEDVEIGNQAAMLQQQMMQRPGQPVDYAALFKQISGDLDFVKDRHNWSYANAPEALLKDWRKKRADLKKRK